jgi:hypothetical protein
MGRWMEDFLVPTLFAVAVFLLVVILTIAVLMEAWQAFAMIKGGCT